MPGPVVDVTWRRVVVAAVVLCAVGVWVAFTDPAAVSSAAPRASVAAGHADAARAPNGASADYVSAPAVIGAFPSPPAFGDSRLHLGTRAGVSDGASLGALQPCSTATMIVLVNARSLPPALRKGKAVLNAWFDWGRAGNWNGAGCGVADWEIQNLPVDLSALPRTGILALPVVFHTGDQVKEFWYRVTISLGTNFTSFAGAAPGPLRSGESEDYHYDALPSTGAAGFVTNAKHGRHGRRGHKGKAGEVVPPGARTAQAGGAQVTCLPAEVQENHQTFVKLNIHPEGLPKPDFAGTLTSANDPVNGPRYQKGDDYRAFLHIAANQKGAAHGTVIVDGIVFKSVDTSHNPHFEDDQWDKDGTQDVLFNFTFSRLGGVQELTCIVTVIHEHLAPKVEAPKPKPPPPPPPSNSPSPPANNPPPTPQILHSASATPSDSFYAGTPGSGATFFEANSTKIVKRDVNTDAITATQTFSGLDSGASLVAVEARDGVVAADFVVQPLTGPEYSQFAFYNSSDLSARNFTGTSTNISTLKQSGTVFAQGGAFTQTGMLDTLNDLNNGTLLVQINPDTGMVTNQRTILPPSGGQDFFTSIAIDPQTGNAFIAGITGLTTNSGTTNRVDLFELDPNTFSTSMFGSMDLSGSPDLTTIGFGQQSIFVGFDQTVGSGPNATTEVDLLPFGRSNLMPGTRSTVLGGLNSSQTFALPLGLAILNSGGTDVPLFAIDLDQSTSTGSSQTLIVRHSTDGGQTWDDSNPGDTSNPSHGVFLMNFGPNQAWLSFQHDTGSAINDTIDVIGFFSP